MNEAGFVGTLKRVAIVGFAFRLPGAQGDALWDALCKGENLITRVDPSRWEQSTYLHPRKSEPGTSYTFAAGSLGDVSGFDAAFFGISPREAAQMDPQQRLLLELTWEAFESGGIRPSAMRGSRCGVYIGFSGSDYPYRRADDLASLDAASMTGSSAAIAANRISYAYDLRGPSMAIDTACSSSLVAFHQACQSLLTGETDQALAGAVNLHLHPFPFIGFSKASMLSRRGLCSAFDASGDGYVRSEGGGVFVLKSLERALEDGDRILAVVAGTGVNCAGKTNGLAVPSYEAQADLLEEVYARAGIDPTEVDYMEAHGTGTAVGDPLEARALWQALGQYRSPTSPLRIGSVKSNLGHLETAAGVAGMVKALYCLRHRSIPPSIHFETANPHIPFEDWNLRVVTENTALAAVGKLVVGVSSFGFGGANGHVILESAPPSPAPVREEADGLPPLVISARSEAALKAAAREHAVWLRRRDDLDPYDIAHSTAFHRDWHEHRAIAFAGDRHALADALTAFAETGKATGVSIGRAMEKPAEPVFAYSGNGSQWAGMGAALLGEDPVFRAAVYGVDALFRSHTDFSIVEALQSEDLAQRLEATEVAQPTLFAIQVGITEMLKAWGITPAAVLGHSVGEVAAAWACGALTLEQAVSVIHHRSSWQATTRGAGTMTAVSLGQGETRALIASLGLEERLAVAAINSPAGVTVSGAPDALDALEAALAARSTVYRRLRLDYAFHSPAMDPIQAGLEQALADLAPAAARIPYYSTVSGEQMDGERLEAAYWWRNIREPVQFEKAVGNILRQHGGLFLEIGPNPVLRGYLNECIRAASAEGRVVATMTKSGGGAEEIRDGAFRLLIAGCRADLGKWFPRKGELVDLPAYPWQRERHWHGLTAEGHDLINRRKLHPLLGYRLRDNEHQWENLLDTSLYPTYADHCVGGAVVFPAAGFAELALAASAQWQPGAQHEVEELEIRAPLLLSGEHSKAVRFSIDPADGSFTVRSRDRLSEEPWLLNAVGRLLAGSSPATREAQLDEPSAAGGIAADEHYRMMESVGLSYGPAFRAVSQVWPGEREVIAALQTPASIREEAAAALLHPSHLDACFQLIVHLLRDEMSRHEGMAFVPVKIGRLRLHRPQGAVAFARASLRRRGPRSLVADCIVYDAQRNPVATLDGVRFRAMRTQTAVGERISYLAAHAVPMPLPAAHRAAPLPDDEALVAACAERLRDPAWRKTQRRYRDEAEPLLDALCASFALRALRQAAQDGLPLDPAALVAAGRVDAGRTALLMRLLRLLEEDGLIVAGVAGTNGRQWAPEAELPEAEDIWNTLLGDYPDFARDTIAVGHVGTHLGDILAGADPAALAPAGNQGEVAASDFEFLRAIADLVGAAAARLPEGRRLRVLEIDSGASSLTARILPSLDRDRCDYVIACRDQASLDEKESLRERYPGVAALLLDPAQADFQAPPGLGESFHILVCAGGVAHTEEQERILANLRALTARNGLLVLLEHRPARATDFILGALSAADDGAWLAERRRRPQSAEAWHGALAQQGFTLQSCLPEAPEEGAGACLLLARARRAEEAAQPVAKSAAAERHWILFHDESSYCAELAARLAAGLRRKGQHVHTALPGPAFTVWDNEGYRLDPASCADWESLLGAARTAFGQVDGIVHLHHLHDPRRASSAESVVERQASRCDSLTQLLRACTALDMAPACCLVTARAATALLPAGASETPLAPADSADACFWGFGRSVLNEYPHLGLRLVDLAEPEATRDMAAGLVDTLLHPDGEDEIILTRHGRYALRLRSVTPDSEAPDRGKGEAARSVVRLDLSAPGQLKNLRWTRQPLPVPAAGQVEIEVRAAGLNFRDVMFAMGMLPDEAVENGFAGATLGMELSGVVVSTGAGVEEFAPGDEVIAFAPASFSSRVITTTNAVVPKPAGWSFESGATIPTTFFTAYYALHQLARLTEGERVLIHGAAGGVGVAAIQLARLAGAEIFATAGSDAKRDFLRLLGADHVLDSRSLAFADDILQLTGGEGVDVVLNSLAGEAINRNLRVLKPFGRFLELGKRDFYENTRIGLRPFHNNIAYFGIDADQLMAERPGLTKRLLGELMAMFEQGALKPLPCTVFPAAEAVEAFRYMQRSRQIGKIVLSFEQDVERLAPARLPARRRSLELSSEASYLVTGGLRGFGLKTARWLAGRGARHLVLASRSGASDAEAQEAIAELTAAGVRVKAAACDITDRAAVQALLAEVRETMPPLRGIVHAAAVIEDGLVRNLKRERIQAVLAPKVAGALHLHELTRGMPLDFLVFFSSATTLFGNPGQANYVAANRYLEVLAAARRAQGLPALCVSWGPIDDVGYLARHTQIRDALQSRMGGSTLKSDDALEVLEQLLVDDISGLGVLDLDFSALRRFLPGIEAPKYAELAAQAGKPGKEESGGENILAWVEKLGSAELLPLFIDMLKKEIGEILRMPPERLDEERSLYDQGMDSLMGVELMAAVESRFGINLPVMALCESPTIARLAEKIIGKLKAPEEPAAAAPSGQAFAAQVRQAAAQHAPELASEQVERFAAELESRP